MRALITGVSGQIGYYLARLLNGRGDAVYGLVQPHAGVHLQAGSEAQHLAEELPFVRQVNGDLLDSMSLVRAIGESAPDVIFHLAAISQPGVFVSMPEIGFQVNAMGVIRLMEACDLAARFDLARVRLVNMSSDCIYGRQPGVRTEKTLVSPSDPYGLSKAMGHLAIQTARESGVPASNAILFNATSPRQRTGIFAYVTSQVAEKNRAGRVRIKQSELELQRDWMHASDATDALLTIAAEPPGDFIVCSGEVHSVFEVLQKSCEIVRRSVSDVSLVSLRVDDAHEPEMFPGFNGKLIAAGWRPTFSFDRLVEVVVGARLSERSLPS